MKLHVVLFACLFLCGAARGQTVRMDDHSDWWSILNESSRGPRVKASPLDVDARTFEIAKVDLTKVGFTEITSRLGKTVHIERGDASTGREQMCYRSPGEGTPAYLVFEFGEDESNFYLFADGLNWKGRGSCATSKELSGEISTASGLRLGLTTDQFKAILGQPDAAFEDKLIYSRAVKVKATPQEFERQRKEYPESLSDKIAHDKFDFYTASIYIEARFTGSKLSYLAVSRSGE